MEELVLVLPICKIINLIVVLCYSDLSYNTFTETDFQALGCEARSL